MERENLHSQTQPNKPVQPLSIQWINLKRAGITCPHPDESLLFETIQCIVNKHNEKRRDKNTNPGYELEKKPERDKIKSYSFKLYCYRKETPSNLSKQEQRKPKMTKTSNFLIFLYQHQPSARIIALTTNNAWSVVRPYVDYSFPVKVAERVCNPNKIMMITRRCLFKENTRETFVNPYEFDLYKTSNLYYLVESFRCEIKSNSKLFNEINCITEADSYWLNVTMGGIIKIGTRLCIEDYPAILDLLANYVEGKPTFINGREEEKDLLFEFLRCLQPAQVMKSKLDELLIKSIFSQYKQNDGIHIHVRHKCLEDFLFSNSFEIKIGSSRFKKIGSKPPTIEEIIDKIPHANEEEFMQAIQTSKLRFKNQASKKFKEKIIDCLEGELRDKDDFYFKMKKMWYVLDWDYLALLHEDFTKVLKNALIKGDEGLKHSWEGSSGPRGKKEEEYNQMYLEEDDFLVFDQICPDNIEPCDILKYTNDAVYLYHVKEKFGQHTRDVCSQILNAAKVIRSALVTRKSPNYLQKLWTQATNFSSVSSSWRNDTKSKLEGIGKERFMNIFRHPKIVFVYAFLPRPNISFSNLLKANDEPIEERIKNKLIKSGYLDSYGRLTRIFFSTNKRDFALEDELQETSNRIYDQLAARQISRSTLAKIELIQLAQNLQNLDFAFKICEIPRKYID